MGKKKKKKKRLNRDQVLAKLINALHDNPLTVEDLILVLSNLIYAVGASIEGYKDKTPPASEVMKEYYAKPGRIGFAMMAQGLLMNQKWPEDLKEVSEEKTDGKSGIRSSLSSKSKGGE